MQQLPERIRSKLETCSERDRSGADTVFATVMKLLGDEEFGVRADTTNAMTVEADWQESLETYTLTFKDVPCVSMRKMDELLSKKPIEDVTVRMSPKTRKMEITVEIFKHSTLQREKKAMALLAEEDHVDLQQNIDGMALAPRDFEAAKRIIHTVVNMDKRMIEPAWEFRDLQTGAYVLTASPMPAMSAAFYNYLAARSRGAVLNCVMAADRLIIHCQSLKPIEAPEEGEDIPARRDHRLGVMVPGMRKHTSMGKIPRPTHSGGWFSFLKK